MQDCFSSGCSGWVRRYTILDGNANCPSCFSTMARN
ncbi:hypothetical protein ACFPMF_01400 [Larkinella bovis]|uniref:Uncharacterized protein n=1 Tax=Larkinella bovis TaxID=683041 RepID=A0ABW0I360_9BACT